MTHQPIKHGEYTIPHSCRFAYRLLTGGYGHTSESRRTGKYRNVDAVTLSGKSSTERKIRLLIENCPGLVHSETVAGKNYKVFWIPLGESVRNGMNHARVTTGSDGVLFEMPSRGRPT